MRTAYAHFTEPHWCGHPRCMYATHDGDLRAIEESLAAHGYQAHQVKRMVERYYLPLREQKA